MPVAVNCFVVFGAMLVAGDAVTETDDTADAVNVVEPVIPLNTAVTTVTPVAEPADTSPFALVLFTVATVEFDVVHETDVRIFLVVPFE